ncbi:MAG: 16S rRNA (cytosine(1402)-N(4))-methyltransferase RsmH [Candidatus Daviesbacteria bacterium]|nr:16S rRNA (cytosine(1402)-N(4))-methyltransferase RsmH [Candidatus Daviesbacteria bacterium]
MSKYHIPVMPKETIEYLNIKPGSWYIDCNLGGGGHTEKILEAGGRVLGIDLDPDSITEVAKKYGLELKTESQGLRAYSKNLILCQTNFAKIKEVVTSSLRANKVSEAISRERIASSPTAPRNDVMGILFDLGVSTHQLEEDQRGFSFNKDAPLDMRMNQNSNQAKAADLINGLHEGELTELFRVLGEENFAKPIARAVVNYREHKRIETTNELASIVLSVRHRSPQDRTHPATRIFQALRIAVNDELHSLKDALPEAFEVLSPSGRIVVISFHSLEDRIVKNFFKELSTQGKGKILTNKPLEPSEEEVLENPRSRSGKMRVIEKVS